MCARITIARRPTIAIHSSYTVISISGVSPVLTRDEIFRFSFSSETQSLREWLGIFRQTILVVRLLLFCRVADGSVVRRAAYTRRNERYDFEYGSCRTEVYCTTIRCGNYRNLCIRKTERDYCRKLFFYRMEIVYTTIKPYHIFILSNTKKLRVWARNIVYQECDFSFSCFYCSSLDLFWRTFTARVFFYCRWSYIVFGDFKTIRFASKPIYTSRKTRYVLRSVMLLLFLSSSRWVGIKMISMITK